MARITLNLLNKLKFGVAQLFPDCRQASLAQSTKLDHPLPPARELGLRLHLLICKWCRRYGKQIQFVRAATQSHSERLTDPSPKKLSNDARARIKARFQR